MSFEEILELKNLINSVPGDKIARFNELFEKALKDAAVDAIDEFANLLKEEACEDIERFNSYTLTFIDEVAEKLKEQK